MAGIRPRKGFLHEPFLRRASWLAGKIRGMRPRYPVCHVHKHFKFVHALVVHPVDYSYLRVAGSG